MKKATTSAFKPASTSSFPFKFTHKNLKIEAQSLLEVIPSESIATTFFDPQYRGILDKQSYGNEGQGRGKRRSALAQMSETLIIQLIQSINRATKSSGHLFLWIDKFHLCEGVQNWLTETDFQTVDLIVWEKPRIGLGYRTRNKCEFLMVLQKKPIRAKGVWTLHNIPNVWQETVTTQKHPHTKPIDLQARLIEATTKEGDIVLDPAMGSGSVLTACEKANRCFIGGDLNGTDLP